MTQASDVYSQKSSRTAAFYRWNILGPARLSVDIGPFLEEIQGQFDPVFKCEIPVNRNALLHRIAKDFVDDFTDALDGARRENGLMRPFEKALVAMDHDKRLNFPMFADWEPRIKPRIVSLKTPLPAQESGSRPRRPTPLQTSQRSDAAAKVDDRDRTSTSKAGGLSPPKQDTSPIKTPRPDVTMAFRHDIIVDKILSKGTSNKTMASDYLKKLQRDQELFPIQPNSQFQFYLQSWSLRVNHKLVFEAQNQASVSGSCIHNQQHQLAYFTRRASGGSIHSKVPPTGFSICTEGPHIQSWGHYTGEEDGIRKYKMNILNTSYATLLPGVVSFFHDLDKIKS